MCAFKYRDFVLVKFFSFHFFLHILVYNPMDFFFVCRSSFAIHIFYFWSVIRQDRVTLQFFFSIPTERLV